MEPAIPRKRWNGLRLCAALPGRRDDVEEEARILEGLFCLAQWPFCRVPVAKKSRSPRPPSLPVLYPVVRTFECW